jgi:hypothetical protein
MKIITTDEKEQAARPFVCRVVVFENEKGQRIEHRTIVGIGIPPANFCPYRTLGVLQLEDPRGQVQTHQFWFDLPNCATEQAAFAVLEIEYEKAVKAEYQNLLNQATRQSLMQGGKRG